MAAYTNFDYDNKTINQWLSCYERGDFHCNDENSIHQAGWLMWEITETLKKEIENLYKCVKIAKDSGKFNPDETFVRLKQVPQFGREDYNYCNVIFYQNPHNIPVIIITPDYKGKTELFVINNKNKVVGDMDAITTYLKNEF